VRDPGADPAAVALEVVAFHERDLDVGTALLRIDALADVVRTTDGDGATADPPGDAAAVVARLGAVLGGRLGYRHDPDHERTWTDAYLHVVLDEHTGLPVTLSALYAAVARRLGVPAFVVNLPGHVVAAAPVGDRHILFDPFHGGRVLDEAAAGHLVTTSTRGRVRFARNMVRPATSAELARRILNNLTVDLAREQHAGAAVWTVVAKLALPDDEPRDHLQLASLLEQSGRWVRAARAYDRYLTAQPDADDADDVRARARAARARTN
jgi:regulator of sirC expression with transglutaminase-like and TPR domain